MQIQHDSLKVRPQNPPRLITCWWRGPLIALTSRTIALIAYHLAHHRTQRRQVKHLMPTDFMLPQSRQIVATTATLAHPTFDNLIRRLSRATLAGMSLFRTRLTFFFGFRFAFCP